MMARPTTPHMTPMAAFAPIDSPELLFSTGALEPDVLLGEPDEAVDEAEDQLVVVEEVLIVVVVEELEDVVVVAKVETVTPPVPIVTISVLKPIWKRPMPESQQPAWPSQQKSRSLCVTFSQLITLTPPCRAPDHQSIVLRNGEERSR